jgi:hypothetical protein
VLRSTSHPSYSQNHTVINRALLCVDQWEEDKYFSLFRYWLKSKGTLQMSLKVTPMRLRTGHLTNFGDKARMREMVADVSDWMKDLAFFQAYQKLCCLLPTRNTGTKRRRR